MLFPLPRTKFVDGLDHGLRHGQTFVHGDVIYFCPERPGNSQGRLDDFFFGLGFAFLHRMVPPLEMIPPWYQWCQGLHVYRAIRTALDAGTFHLSPSLRKSRKNSIARRTRWTVSVRCTFTSSDDQGSARPPLRRFRMNSFICEIFNSASGTPMSSLINRTTETASSNEQMCRGSDGSA